MWIEHCLAKIHMNFSNFKNFLTITPEKKLWSFYEYFWGIDWWYKRIDDESTMTLIAPQMFKPSYNHDRGEKIDSAWLNFSTEIRGNLDTNRLSMLRIQKIHCCQGPICSSLCPLNSTGPGCNETCPCQNNGRCLPEEAGCDCTSGWTGEVCADPCDDSSWGANCARQCPECFNGVNVIDSPATADVHQVSLGKTVKNSVL